MRLLFIDTNPGWGGGQKWCLDTARGLAARGASVTVACVRGTRLHERCSAARLALFELAPAGGSFVSGLRLARWARRARPEVVIATLGRDSRAGALVKLACGARLVQRRGIARPIGRHALARALALRSVDRFVANCEAIREALLLGPPALGETRVELILNAVEPAPQLERADARTALGIAPDEQLVLAVGRLAPMKGQRLLFEAWKEVEARLPQARLLVAGSGPEAGALEQLRRALAHPERVRLLGFREDTALLLAAADLYVQPSIRDEGTSHALLEALAAGRPALVSRAGGLEQTILRCGGGRAHATGDARALASGMIELLGAPAELERLGREGRAGVEAHHAPLAILEQWERLLGGLARWRTPPSAATTRPEARR